MALTCNIDSRGKRARLIYGVLMVLLGAALIVFWAWPQGQIWKWIVSIACLGGGAFAMFEARAGWCAIRAMGIKTPM
jgi:hypothetical protein